MKKVLYISNIPVPYRVRFLNELSRCCDLTVLFERQNSDTRNGEWTGSEPLHCKTEYLNGWDIGGEWSFSLKILKYLFSDYDKIIIGCYNSPVQMLAVLVMRFLGISYCLNTDGEVFAQGKGVKRWLKRFFLRGAEQYLTAGEQSARSLRRIVGEEKTVTPYYFSSLSLQELGRHRRCPREHGKHVLVVGQYLPCKGLDLAVKAAKRDPDTTYLFVGTGKRSQQFIREQQTELFSNIKVIPFLQKKQLYEEYRRCAILVLPSRQECWGLVLPEAASFGTPIVSTWGSGAAVEFLSEQYPQYLARVDDAESLYQCIQRIKASDTIDYSDFLKQKAAGYSIERSVKEHQKLWR